MSGIGVELFVKLHISVPSKTINYFIMDLLKKRAEMLIDNFDLDLKLCMVSIYLGSDKFENLTEDQEATYVLVRILAALTKDRHIGSLLTTLVTYPYEHFSAMTEDYFDGVQLDSNHHDLANLTWRIC